MDSIGTIASVVAAVTGIIAIWNGKKNVLRRIDRKTAKIQAIDNKQIKLYGINGHAPHIITKLDIKRERLSREVEYLRRQL